MVITVLSCVSMKNNEEMTTDDLNYACQKLIMYGHDGLIEKGLIMLTDNLPPSHVIGRRVATFLNRFQPDMYTSGTNVSELFAVHHTDDNANNKAMKAPMLDSRFNDKWFTDIQGLSEPWFIHHNPDTHPFSVMTAMLATNVSTNELTGLFASLDALHSDESFLIKEGAIIIPALIMKAYDDIIGPEIINLPMGIEVCDELIANIRTLVDAMERLKVKLDDDGWNPDTSDARMLALIASQYSDMLYTDYDESTDMIHIIDCLNSRCLDLMQAAVSMHDDSMLVATLAFKKTALILLNMKRKSGGGNHPSADNLFHNEDERIMNAMRAMLDDVHMPDEFTIEHVSAMLDE